MHAIRVQKSTILCDFELILGQKNYFFKNRKNNARTKTKVFLDCNGQKLFRTIEKT